MAYLVRQQQADPSQLWSQKRNILFYKDKAGKIDVANPAAVADKGHQRLHIFSHPHGTFLQSARYFFTIRALLFTILSPVFFQ
jgi:hypothetical protein